MPKARTLTQWVAKKLEEKDTIISDLRDQMSKIGEYSPAYREYIQYRDSLEKVGPTVAPDGDPYRISEALGRANAEIRRLNAELGKCRVAKGNLQEGCSRQR